MAKAKTGKIRIGIGGWTYKPWRGAFYPDKLAQRRELEYASARLTAIEINGTYYGSQKPETFAKWRDETPDGFLFSLKASRYATNRRVLADAGESVERFITGGMTELKDRLGPILWQFATTKQFDSADFEAFLKLLPASHDGRELRHVLDVRHESFRVPEFVQMAREYGAGIVLAADSEHPQIADPTAGFVYARIFGTREGEPKGYPDADLDLWAKRAKAWAAGKAPAGLEYVEKRKSDSMARDVFLYVIAGHKVANPAAAMALIERVG